MICFIGSRHIDPGGFGGIGNVNKNELKVKQVFVAVKAMKWFFNFAYLLLKNILTFKKSIVSRENLVLGV